MLAHARGQAPRGRSHQSTTETSDESQVGPQRGTFAGGYVAIPTEELVAVWSALQAGGIEQLDIRTWLAARELRERRRFAHKDCEPCYELGELEGLVGRVGEVRLRASLGRLRRAGLVRWSSAKLEFVEALATSSEELRCGAEAMLAQMPRARRTFPMPRRVLRLLAGGVKKSVLATVLAHLVRCPHYTKSRGWNGEGTCKASWIAETFGISERSAVRARVHVIEELAWLRPIATDQWRMNRFGGRFEVDLAWSGELTSGPVGGGGGDPAELSTGVLSPPTGAFEPRLSPPESEQPSSSKIEKSELAAERGGPPSNANDFRRTRGEPERPSLRKVVRGDLRQVERVMELFDQALDSPLWRAKGWTPKDTPGERLNWAAAARRANVRGGPNPPGLFVHLVSLRKWGDVSNDDEDAVRQALSRWRNPEPEAEGLNLASSLFGRGKVTRALSADGAVLRRIEDALRGRAVVTDGKSIDRELIRSGWSEERVREARRELAAWKAGERALAELEG